MPDYSLLDRHSRITKIGELMAESKPLTDEDRNFLSEALISIGAGADPQKCLDIKVTRGGTPLKTQRKNYQRDKFALAWLAAAMASDEDEGLALTLDGAIDLLHLSNPEQVFGITEDTIRKYWNNRPSDRGVVFYPYPALKD